MIKSLESGDFMNLRHLQFFVKLAQTQHMAKAAESLGISQPSLSYAISSLEDELGVPLFEKDGRNIKLTNYGKIYLKYVEQSLKDLQQGSDYLKELLDVNNGHINLGFTFTMGQDLVPHLIREFLEKPQYKNITFSFKQDTTENLLTDLIDEKLDLVFCSAPNTSNQKSQINLCHLVNQEIMGAVPLDHPLSQKKCVTLKELAHYPFIAYSDQSGLKPTIEKLFEREKIHPNIKLEAIEDHTIIGFVHWNFGVAIIPHLPQLADNQVKLLHLDTEKNWHELYVATKSNHFMTPSVSIFQEFVEQYCQKYYLKPNKLI